MKSREVSQIRLEIAGVEAAARGEVVRGWGGDDHNNTSEIFDTGLARRWNYAVTAPFLLYNNDISKPVKKKKL